MKATKVYVCWDYLDKKWKQGVIDSYLVIFTMKYHANFLPTKINIKSSQCSDTVYDTI